MIRAATARTASALTASMLAVMLLLAGCASPAAYSEETAQDLQQRVLAVTDAAATADYAAAQVRIEELRAAANDALAKGELTEERYSAIVSALDLVESDISTALAAEEAAAREAARLAEEAAAEEAARLAEEKAKEEQQDKPGKGNKDDD